MNTHSGERPRQLGPTPAPWKRTAATLASLATLFLDGPTARAEDLVLTNAMVIDGTGAAPMPGMTLSVSGGRIAAIERGAPAPAADVIDLRGRTLLPGLIDAHAHIQDPASALRALRSGVTTARVLGDAYLQALGTRDLIRASHVPGPELLVSGGHVRPKPGEAFFVTFPQFGAFLDGELRGAETIAGAVRALIERGADVIKVGASERAGLASTDPRKPELSFEEMQAAVQEATRAGRFVAAHAHARSGANAAVRAGVRSVEHGTYLDEETLQLMKTRGTFLVPTLAVMSPLGDPRGGSADAVALQLRTHHMQKPIRDVVRRARALGIPIAASTDGSYADGEDTGRIRVAHDVEELVACGLPALEALSAATRVGAQVLGIEGRTGTLRVGHEADLLVVDRDPLQDLTTLFEPMLVVSNGKVVLNRLD